MTETEASSRVRPRSLHFTKRFAIISAFAGLAMFVVQILYTTYSVRGVDGLQVETVKILRYDDAASGKGGCGRGSDPIDLLFESRNPPKGQPATFWVRDQCVPALDQGDTVPLAREIVGGKVVKYWIDPTVSYSEAFWTSLGSGLLAFAFVLAVCWIGLAIRQVWLKYFWHD